VVIGYPKSHRYILDAAEDGPRDDRVQACSFVWAGITDRRFCMRW